MRETSLIGYDFSFLIEPAWRNNTIVSSNRTSTVDGGIVSRNNIQKFERENW